MASLGSPNTSRGVAWAARIMRAGKTVADRLLRALFFLRWLRPRRKHEADLGGSLAFFGFACHFTQQAFLPPITHHPNRVFGHSYPEMPTVLPGNKTYAPAKILPFWTPSIIRFASA